jgi:hypothetical protein
MASPEGSGGVTAKEIIDLLIEEMRQELMPSKFCTFVRNVFHVALSPSEYERFRNLVAPMRQQAIKALNEELARLNGARLAKVPGVNRFVGRERFEKIGEWVIDFEQNHDDDADDTPLIIYSSFSEPESADDREGSATVRVVRRTNEGSTSTARVTASSATSENKVIAVLEYNDNTGPHTYQMTSSSIKIGRGGAGHYVDVALESAQDVSREHCSIRRDPETGRFFIRDVSRFGTSVNGATVRPARRRDGEQEVDEDIEDLLPDKAKIELAGVITLRFRREK